MDMSESDDSNQPFLPRLVDGKTPFPSPPNSTSFNSRFHCDFLRKETSFLELDPTEESTQSYKHIPVPGCSKDTYLSLAVQTALIGQSSFVLNLSIDRHFRWSLT